MAIWYLCAVTANDGSSRWGGSVWCNLLL